MCLSRCPRLSRTSHALPTTSLNCGLQAHARHSGDTCRHCCWLCCCPLPGACGCTRGCCCCPSCCPVRVWPAPWPGGPSAGARVAPGMAWCTLAAGCGLLLMPSAASDPDQPLTARASCQLSPGSCRRYRVLNTCMKSLQCMYTGKVGRE